MLNEFTGTVLQLFVFAFIPLTVYLINKRKLKGFLAYIGLKKSNARANYLALFSSLIIALPFISVAYLSDDFRAIMLNPESITGKFREMGFGFESVVTLLLIAIIKTALTEEILFRGFIAKRLIAITNFKVGNTLHALIFGVIHTLLFLMISQNVLFLLIIFIFPAIGAYVMAYINEQEANGSIVPGWISHATANLISYSFFGFVS